MTTVAAAAPALAIASPSIVAAATMLDTRESPDPVIALAGAARTATAEFETSFARLEAAHQIMMQWHRRNPRPEMRETQVPAPGSLPYDLWYEAEIRAVGNSLEEERVRLLDPNRDLKAAMKDHVAAVNIYNARKSAAQRQSGMDEAFAAEKRAARRRNKALNNLLLSPSQSAAGLVEKTRALEAIVDDNETQLRAAMACSLADDIHALLDMETAPVEIAA